MSVLYYIISHHAIAVTQFTRYSEGRRAAGAEEHQRVPPEVAEPGMEFGKHWRVLYHIWEAGRSPLPKTKSLMLGYEGATRPGAGVEGRFNLPLWRGLGLGREAVGAVGQPVNREAFARLGNLHNFVVEVEAGGARELDVLVASSNL